MLVENVQQSVCVICKICTICANMIICIYCIYIYTWLIYNHVDIRYTHDFCCLPFSVSVTHAAPVLHKALWIWWPPGSLCILNPFDLHVPKT